MTEILTSAANGLGHITLNRPAVPHALNTGMCAAIMVLALLVLSSCERSVDNQPMARAQALEAIEHACIQKAELRFTNFDPASCSCARARIGDEFQQDGELSVMADLAGIEVQMGTTSVDDFQALERNRREYNLALGQVSDASRRLRVSTALRDAVSACRAPL